MPELNREDIIKALDCCIGGRDYEDCTACPYDKRKYNCVICLMTDALTLIKQLTEEKREIFEEIEKIISHKRDLNGSEIAFGYEWALAEVRRQYTDLKKKYIGE